MEFIEPNKMQEQEKSDYHLTENQLNNVPDGSRQMYYSAIATVEEGMVLQTADGSIQACNASAENILGLTVEQMQGWTCLDSSWRVVQEDGSPWNAQNHPVIVTWNTGKPCSHIVFGLYKPNGELIWLLINSQPLFRARETTPYAIVLRFTDITKQKLVSDGYGGLCQRQSREIVQPSEQQWQAALLAAGIGTWEWNIITNQIAWSGNLVGMFGLEPESFDGRYQTFVERLHPDDRERVLDAIARSINYKADYDIEFRVVFPDGRIRWSASKGQVFDDETGRPVRMAGIDIDITERKQIEQSLQNAMLKLNLYMENSPLAAIEWDQEFRISHWSQKAEGIFGWQAEEMIGKKFSDWQFVYPEDEAAVNEVTQRLIKGSQTQLVCHNRNYTKNGSVIHCEWYNSTLLDASGKRLILSQLLDVTERKQVEAALRASEELFRHMADTSPTLIWMSDADKRCYYLNKPWLEFRGRTMAQEIGHGWLQGVHPDDLQSCLDSYINAFDARQEFRIEYRLQRFDGEYRWVLDVGIPRFTSEGNFLGYIGSCLDITKRKQADAEREQMLVRSRQHTRQLHGLTEAALAINSLLSIEEVLRLITQQARVIVGAHQSLTSITVEHNWAKAIHSVSLSDKYAAWQGYAEQPDGSGIYALVCQMNRPVRMTQAELEAHPRWQGFGKEARNHPPMRGWLVAPMLGRDGRNMGLIQLSDKYEGEFTEEDEAMIVQLAQLASVALENSRLYAAEQWARKQAEEANCIKDEFLAILSHELRSPLNPILGWSKLLQKRKFDELKTVEALATIERNAKLQAQLVEDLLDVSRIIQGKLTLNVNTVSLVSTIEAALETINLAAEAKTIDLQFLQLSSANSESVDSSFLVMGDANRLQQIVWNLLSNAVKFTPPGGKVQIQLELVGSYAQIQVSDTGKGIKPNFLPYIFDYFRQEDSATTRKFGGLGLGLAIAKQLVELHGGTILAESPGEEQGTIFTVKLPLLHTKQTASDDQPEVEVEADLGNLQGIKILVVDDELDSRNLISFLLEEEGAKVIGVSSAIEALQTLPEYQPDMLLSDIGMPDMDGYTLMRQIRTCPPEKGGNIPAIALTAYAGEYNQQQAITAGFQMHITKPAEPSELVAAVVKLTGKKN
ncbi:multi-sensor hybrid histidine kinase [Cylindrospermum sp. NIES-4074]|nr:multi-sensor hybrid histidine kinase [Cylindrospermum sp. NIES-4074]